MPNLKNQEFSMPKAAWSVHLAKDDKSEAVDLTPAMAPRLITLSLTEKRGGEADQLEIALDASDGALRIPPHGAVLTVSLGWQRGSGVPVGLVGKGTFHVDEVGASGPPDIITLRARAANLTSGFRVRKDRSFVDQTVGAIVSAIAADNGYSASIDPDLASKVIPALGHGPMSDAALLKALGHRFDATATVKNGTLIFAPVGHGKTASGKALPAITINRRDAPAFTFTAPKRGQYDGVEARWHDKGSATQHTVHAGHSGSGTAKRLRKVYASAADAQDAADSANRRMAREGAKLDLTLPLGRPDWFPDLAVTASGYMPEINDIGWLIAEISHTMDGSGGLTSRLSLETGPAKSTD